MRGISVTASAHISRMEKGHCLSYMRTSYDGGGSYMTNDNGYFYVSTTTPSVVPYYLFSTTASVYTRASRYDYRGFNGC